jgi:hypothetical protein
MRINSEEGCAKLKDFGFDDDPDLTELMDELESIVEDNRETLEDLSSDTGARAGIMTISQALASNDPLINLRNEMSGSNSEQRLFINVYGAMLDIDSAGVSILWDRNPFAEVDRLAQQLREIRALDTLAAIKELRSLMVQRLGDPPDQDKLYDFIMEGEFESMAKIHDLKAMRMADEIEARLLEYARANAHKLGL